MTTRSPAVSRRRPLLAALFLAPLLPACASDAELAGIEPTGPCDVPQACVVSGVDLVVEPPRVLWPEDTPVDDLTGYRIVDPGSVFDVEVTIRNRGDRTSSVETLLASEPMTLPVLAPGESFVDTIAYTVYQPESHQTHFGVYLDRFFATLYTGELDDDPIHANDENVSQPFHVRHPAVLATFVLPTDRFRLGESYPIEVTLRNASRHVAVPPRTLTFCWFNDFDGCGKYVSVPMGTFAVPSLEPGDEWSATIDLEIPLDASYWLEPLEWYMYGCLGPEGATTEELAELVVDLTLSCAEMLDTVTALPNYEATCEVAVIAADTIVAGDAAADCIEPDMFDSWDIYAMDVVAGDVYHLLGDLPFVASRDGELLELQEAIGEDGNMVAQLVIETTERIYLALPMTFYHFEVRRP